MDRGRPVELRKLIAQLGLSDTVRSMLFIIANIHGYDAAIKAALTWPRASEPKEERRG